MKKQQLIDPWQPLHFGHGFVKFFSSTTCLGVMTDNQLSWHAQVDRVKGNVILTQGLWTDFQAQLQTGKEKHIKNWKLQASQ